MLFLFLFYFILSALMHIWIYNDNQKVPPYQVLLVEVIHDLEIVRYGVPLLGGQ